MYIKQMVTQRVTSCCLKDTFFGSFVLEVFLGIRYRQLKLDHNFNMSLARKCILQYLSHQNILGLTKSYRDSN